MHTSVLEDAAYSGVTAFEAGTVFSALTTTIATSRLAINGESIFQTSLGTQKTSRSLIGAKRLGGDHLVRQPYTMFCAARYQKFHTDLVCFTTV